ncbi:Alpha/Beta hydrolase protein [Fennellomyces sp. T-0311]|nr:Alpha/Beta hydrolase protein [Fennellomyces sp. T-0311]
MDPNDPTTFRHQYCQANGIRIQYIDENQSSKKVLLLIHGWPDLWCGWREQIPFLVNLGYRVVVPTLRGYGETDAPAETSAYGEKSICGDFAALLDYLQIPTVVVLGHDWGGMSAWRFAQFYPERVLAVGSFCTPYTPPEKVYYPLEEIVKRVPNFGYQLHLVTPAAEAEINNNTEAFFKRIFRPVAEAESLLDKKHNMLVQGRPEVQRSDAISQKVIDYYVAMYKKAGAGGSLQLYKRRKYSYEDCKDLNPMITKPALMVTADLDKALPPSMARGILKHVPNAEIYNVKDSGHWVLWEKPAECNAILDKWLAKIFPTTNKL